jgi:hypothetical protein
MFNPRGEILSKSDFWYKETSEIDTYILLRQAAVLTRVTRLGEFSLIGWLFTLAIFLKKDRNVPHNWATFSKVVYKFGKNLQYFGYFFKNVSGHPGPDVPYVLTLPHESQAFLKAVFVTVSFPQ